MGPKLRSILGASSGSRVHIRQPFSYVTRNQANDMTAVPPLGSLFADLLRCPEVLRDVVSGL